MVTFAEVISFFGAASFFAWLAFIVFQDEQLTDYAQDLKKLKIARVHLFTVYDFFLMSFACYAVAFVADYLVHLTDGYLLIGFDTFHSPLLYGIIGAFCILGLLTLALPLAYIRSMSKGTTDPLNVNPPNFAHTLVRFPLGIMNLVAAMAEFNSIQNAPNWLAMAVWHGFWLLMLLVAAVGFFLSLRDWNASPRRIFRNGFLLFLPLISEIVTIYLFANFGLLLFFE